jgi:hypothetical protein
MAWHGLAWLGMAWHGLAGTKATLSLEMISVKMEMVLEIGLEIGLEIYFRLAALLRIGCLQDFLIFALCFTIIASFHQVMGTISRYLNHQSIHVNW